MRIIAGKYKGYKFKTYAGDNTRPTTDLAKEGLFNALDNIINIEGKTIVDLFAGTGNIGIEFLSRGAASLQSVDANAANITFMKNIQKELNINTWEITKSDALSFIRKMLHADVLFADPPYHYTQLHQLVNDVAKSGWFLQNNTVFILEHSDKLVFDAKYLFLKKQYGSTCFSLFKA